MAITSTSSGGTYIGLIAANTILTSAMPMLIILGGLSGLMLSPTPILATLPASVQTLAGLFAAGPFSIFMGQFGRRTGFTCGATLAILGGITCAWALYIGSFIALCLGHMALGAALACYQYFRFAAAEVAPEKWQPVAISLMLTSGLIAAFLGPQVFIWAKDYFPLVPLAGAYMAISGLSLLGLIPLTFVRITAAAPASSIKRPTLSSFAILQQPHVLLAVGAGAVSQGIMVFLMAPTPLAMINCGFSEALAGDVIRWHVVSMFAPSFFTGFIIKRYGALPVVKLGLLLLIHSAGIAATGLSKTHFYTALILLGVGWNFGFIGSTSLLASTVSAENRPVAQGVNDTVIALASTLCAFAAGAIVTGPGWTTLALAALPVLAGTMIVMRILRSRLP